MNRFTIIAVAVLTLTSTSVFAQKDDNFINFPGLAVSPHAAWGGGWTTSIYINDFIGQGPATLTVKFWDKRRVPVKVPYKTHSGLSGSGEELRLQFGGQHKVEIITLSSPEPQVSTGWVSIESSSSGYLQSYEVFRSNAPGRPDLEASIPFIVPNTDNRFRFFAYDHRENSETGFAVLQGPPSGQNSGSATVKIACYENSQEVANTELLPVGGGNVYGAWTLTSVAPGTAGKVGSCRVYTVRGSDEPFLNVIAFKFAPGGSFTTVPISR